MTQSCLPYLVLFSYPKETQNTQKPKRLLRKKEKKKKATLLAGSFRFPCHINSKGTVCMERLLADVFCMLGREGEIIPILQK